MSTGEFFIRGASHVGRKSLCLTLAVCPNKYGSSNASPALDDGHLSLTGIRQAIEFLAFPNAVSEGFSVTHKTGELLGMWVAADQGAASQGPVSMPGG